MISVASTKFEYIDNKNQRSIVLIPGWATDYRIFDKLRLKFNYIIPVSFSPWDFAESLADFLLKNNIRTISLFGFSLGGFVAAEFSSQYPELINSLILVSIRKKYKVDEIEDVRKNLKKNKKAYLYKFYKLSFYKREELLKFKDTLLKFYLDNLQLNYLLNTLDYLGGSVMRPDKFETVKDIKIIHGEEDYIAPIKEAIQLKNNLDSARLITFKETGHNPFFKEPTNLTNLTRLEQGG